MAGTIFGLPLSQRVDSNGDPLVGWLLYLYVQNSSTPVNSYSDTALTVLNPWPIEADASGMMPIFWLADGSYRVRATSNDGATTLFDLPSVLALGASTGSAPSGSVDPNAIYATGDVMWQPIQGTRAGWVRDNGRTIGSASSGANERANADCQPLFLFMWNNFSDVFCPVLGGRGLNALADWTANKKITMLDMRGYVAGGLDDMGNSAASRWTGAPVILGSVTTGGGTVGENTHTLVTAELALHSHSLSSGAHTHQQTGFTGTSHSSLNITGLAGGPVDVVTGGQNVATASGNPGLSMGDAGSGTAHNTAQLTCLGTFFRKL